MTDCELQIGYVYNSDMTCIGRVDFQAEPEEGDWEFTFQKDGTFTIRPYPDPEDD